MKALIFLIFITGCIQDFNSSSGDRERYGARPDIFPPNTRADSSQGRLAKAFKVIEENCLTCHFSFHNTWASNTTDQSWISTGLVVPGDPFSSRLISKLQNIGGNMPFQNAPLSEDDFNTLVEWINLME